MKMLYILILFIGFVLAVIMPFVCVVFPRDAYVASVLSSSPEQWSVEMNEELTTRFSNFDVKKELATALQKRASFRNGIYIQSFWEGLVLIVLSIVGLIRESKIEKLRKTIKAPAEATELITKLDSGNGTNTFKEQPLSENDTDDPMVAVALSGVGIEDIAKILSNWTGKAVIPSEEAKNLRLTIFSPEQLPQSKAIELLYTAIREQGFIIEETDDTIYIKKMSSLHAEKGAKYIMKFMRRKNLMTQEEREKVAEIISNHDKKDEKNLDAYSKVVQDADILSRYGAVYLFSDFYKSGLKRRTRKKTVGKFRSKNHDKYLSDLDKLNYDYSRNELRKEYNYIKEFYIKLEEEIQYSNKL